MALQTIGLYRSRNLYDQVSHDKKEGVVRTANACWQPSSRTYWQERASTSICQVLRIPDYNNSKTPRSCLETCTEYYSGFRHAGSARNSRVRLECHRLSITISATYFNPLQTKGDRAVPSDFPKDRGSDVVGEWPRNLLARLAEAMYQSGVFLLWAL